MTQNQMALMCEDEDKTVPTVIKRSAQGSKSKGLQNLRIPVARQKPQQKKKLRRK